MLMRASTCESAAPPDVRRGLFSVGNCELKCHAHESVNVRIGCAAGCEARALSVGNCELKCHAHGSVNVRIRCTAGCEARALSVGNCELKCHPHESVNVRIGCAAGCEARAPPRRKRLFLFPGLCPPPYLDQGAPTMMKNTGSPRIHYRSREDAR